MTTIIQQHTSRPVPTNWPAPTDNPVLDALLGGLERAGARLPYPLALPVLLAHAALSGLAHR
ncbi:hypothetical protein SAMN02800687_0872 [Curtobacterium sp. UNCCL20]|uniref:hypothetical protein n=1 Tax=Curtobacterium sp. UNCCL20 TaxID=1502773 RepID=UPI00088EC1DE|nr:hypothetical protein [Curtobacterium sp. UNCCL20]SDQ21217.1 hypothetical protein SAMN02800687_0872 [Curtobacterium sp. UNCCL20]